MEHIFENKNVIINRVRLEYSCSSRRLIMLDYDGTLVPFNMDPLAASPDHVLLGILSKLASDRRNTVAVLSGRRKEDLDRFFPGLPITLGAEHGLWLKRRDGEWARTATPDTGWLIEAQRIILAATGIAAGSFIETKSSSVAFHYRGCSEEDAAMAVDYIRREVSERMNGDFSVLCGNRVVEIKSSEFNKGLASKTMISAGGFDFILCCGDDTTDEDMFSVLPDYAIAVKVGEGDTIAGNSVSSVDDIRQLLLSLAESDRMTQSGGS